MYRMASLALGLLFAVVSAGCEGGGSNPVSPSALVDSDVTAGDETSEPQGRGGKPRVGGGTLALVMVIDANGDGAPNWGDTITFNVTTTATSEPTVSVVCSQNRVDVYGATAGFYDSYPWPWKRNMGLWSGVWTSGAAKCTAKLHPLGASGTVLAMQSFTAEE